MSGDGWRQGGVWGGRTLPSGVVAGLRRGVAGNASEKKSRAVLERSMPLLPTMQKAGWRPLGGLKPRPMLAKRRKCWVRQAASVLGSSSGNFSLPPFTGEGARRVEGRIKSPGDVNAGFAKRRRCWALPLPLLLLRHCRQRLYIFLSATALPCYFKSCQAA